ncbi:FadR/GntR family transcriptional regulator [Paramicrobacterium chengjingii]|uniref:FadR/GntR family transcriptional regulator n=1 Tax=Paramicrobacterium chengjingii TaxID=2769067 RepID=UPI001421020E|nr:FCD domain-containing protein [Microbacterium chengjingii]
MQVHDLLGMAICDRRLPENAVITVEDLEAATGISRSVVRESARVLGSLGLLHAKKRVGLRILPESEWNVFDPQIIRWRLESPERARQIRELLEVRLAVEPDAARLASEVGSAELAGQIISVAGALWTCAVEGDADAFSRNDALFHRLILEASGNSMFLRLSGVIRESLHERNMSILGESHASMVDVGLHLDLARHVQRRQGEDAAQVTREIIRRTQADEAG